MRSKEYAYYVVCHHDADGGYGIGSLAVSRPTEIKTPMDVMNLSDEIKRNKGCNNVIITYWKLME